MRFYTSEPLITQRCLNVVREVHVLVREVHVLVREVHVLVREVHMLVRRGTCISEERYMY